MGILIAIIVLPLIFVIVATYAVFKIAALMIRLMFLTAALVLVLRRPRY